MSFISLIVGKNLTEVHALVLRQLFTMMRTSGDQPLLRSSDLDVLLQTRDEAGLISDAMPQAHFLSCLQVPADPNVTSCWRAIKEGLLNRTLTNPEVNGFDQLMQTAELLYKSQGVVILAGSESSEDGFALYATTICLIQCNMELPPEQRKTIYVLDSSASIWIELIRRAQCDPEWGKWFKFFTFQYAVTNNTLGHAFCTPQTTTP